MFHFFADPLQASNWQAKDLRIFRYLEAGISHLLEDHFGDSNLERWSQSVSSTLTAIVFKLLWRSMAGFNLTYLTYLKIFNFVEAAHLLEDNIGDSNLECRSQSVSAP